LIKLKITNAFQEKKMKIFTSLDFGYGVTQRLGGESIPPFGLGKR
jgi:hypothetical protein